jgi:NAD-reducing hydrogenase large subunit
MPSTIVIPHISRIEGHGRVTIHLDDAGKVASTQFHVTQIRGFEKFVEGRPYYEMPSITARICGICPVSHLLASVKACDAIMAVSIPPAARLLRELLHCAQFVQSHALSFFHLSAPDLLLGFDSDSVARNITGLIEKHPDVARDGIALRKFGQQAIERLAGERIHPSWTVPGGVNTPLKKDARDAILTELPIAKSIARRTLKLVKSFLDRYPAEVESFGNEPALYAGLTTGSGDLRIYDGILRFRDPVSGTVIAQTEHPADYARCIGEAVLPHSYLKAPYFKPRGFPGGIYRVGPLARLNVAERCATPEADLELAEYRQRLGRDPQSAFFYHYARQIETMFCLERMEERLHHPNILDTRVRARAQVNAPEGVGIIEAPRGTLIHHYKVDENGAMQWANLIVATGHNNLAMNHAVHQVAERFVDGNSIQEGMLNRVSAVIRAFDPCLSCSTHALGQAAIVIELRGPDDALLDTLQPSSLASCRIGSCD